MATHEKEFAVLLNQAPLYQKSKTVTLTGSLARSSEKGKFALMQSDGNVVMLDIDAVKSHKILGSSFGQQLVQVELDAERVPKEMIEQPPTVNPFYSSGTGSPAALDVPHTGTWNDVYKPLLDHPFTLPYLDHSPKPPLQMLSQLMTNAATDHFTGYKDNPRHGSIGPNDIPVPLQSEAGYYDPLAVLLPFLLATAHQAPADAISQM